ncbi:efflux RND transporter periplasmic adaptor subunit [Caulobacter sp. S45]|uniref:efflux RND transporter periplasmic adaptor subunit n=1 Tax=Caulobacter sp. S45 TaxID=1641861 RepID=UPI00131CDA44|nr:efflux RND transporter periplasmic adaptor subunit [Caulobacter sp. S45]
MTRSFALALLAVSAVAAPALADGTTLVRTETPRRGSAPRTFTAYGSAAASSLAARSLTLPQTGQVVSVLVTQSQAVRKGQALLSFATAPSAISGYRQAQTAVTLARAQQQHAVQLLAQQLGTKDQLAVADKAVADAQAQLSALAREGAGRASVTLTAPFDGVIATVPVAPGDRPAAGAALVTLNRSSGVQVSLGLEPGWRSQVKVGQAVRLEPLGGGPAIDGHVIRVDAVLNPRSRLLDVDIAVPAGQAISGEAFRARVAVGVLQGWLLPHEAVRVEDGKAFVFQVAGGKAHRVDVEVAQAGRDVDVAQGPLDPARPLVTVGAYQLDDGDAVRTR